MEDSFENNKRAKELVGFEGEAMEPEIMLLHAMLTGACFSTYSFPEVSIPTNFRDLVESD